MLRWFRALLPREERFFELFARHAKTGVQGAMALEAMLRGGDETPVFCQRVNQFENDADGITREVLTAVRRTFITPFDRVDIKNLITSMDDAIDQMQQTAKAVVLFEVRAFEPPMREIGALLVECANLVARAGDSNCARDRRRSRDGDHVVRDDPVARSDASVLLRHLSLRRCLRAHPPGAIVGHRNRSPDPGRRLCGRARQRRRDVPPPSAGVAARPSGRCHP